MLSAWALEGLLVFERDWFWGGAAAVAIAFSALTAPGAAPNPKRRRGAVVAVCDASCSVEAGDCWSSRVEFDVVFVEECIDRPSVVFCENDRDDTVLMEVCEFMLWGNCWFCTSRDVCWWFSDIFVVLFGVLIAPKREVGVRDIIGVVSGCAPGLVIAGVNREGVELFVPLISNIYTDCLRNRYNTVGNLKR